MKKLSVPEEHQRKIAVRTLVLSEQGARIMGGMDHREAVKVLKSFCYSDRFIVERMQRAGHDDGYINSLVQAS